MSEATNVVYCVDTSCFRELARHYPQAIFPGVYEALEGLIIQGRIVTIEDVLDEYIEESVKQWVETQSHALVRRKDAAVIACLQEIMRDHPDFVDASKTTQEADQPLVALACALVRSGLAITVVTQETRRGSHGKRLKIPDPCECYSIPCVNLLSMMSLETWRFGRTALEVLANPADSQQTLF